MTVHALFNNSMTATIKSKDAIKQTKYPPSGDGILKTTLF